MICKGTAKSAQPCALEPEPGGTHTVTRVLDVETLLLDDGRQVRLIGALGPRSWAEGVANRPEPALAAVQDLVQGRAVELGYGGRRVDRYGRRLAHVFALVGAEKIWVQARLIEGGHARVYALPGSDECLTELLAKEQLARQSDLGLWSLPDNRVQSADKVRELMQRAGQFAIVEGRVRHVAVRALRTYLNFGDDWRRDFTVSIATKLTRGNERASAFLRSLEGRSVRVRGWVQRRNGPLIEASSLAEIEPLDDIRPEAR